MADRQVFITVDLWAAQNGYSFGHAREIYKRIENLAILKGINGERYIIPEGTPWPLPMKSGAKKGSKHRLKIPPVGYVQLREWAVSNGRCYQAAIQAKRHGKIPNLIRVKTTHYVPIDTPWPARKLRLKKKNRSGKRISKYTQKQASEFIAKLKAFK